MSLVAHNIVSADLLTPENQGGPVYRSGLPGENRCNDRLRDHRLYHELESTH